MIQNSFSNFFKTTDGEQILYTTNFPVGDDFIHEDVLMFNYGLVCSNHHWKEQIPFFDKLGHKVLIHDYRGHYQSTGSHNVSSVTFENITNDMFGICKSLNINSTIQIGHSMGVNVTLEFTRKFPELVKKMILMSGTVIPVDNIMFDSNIMDHLRPSLTKLSKIFPNEFKSFWKFSGRNPIVKKMVHMGGFNIEEVSDEFIEIYVNKLGQLGPDLFFQLLDEMQKHDILAHLPQINIPTLIIGGDNDKVIPNYLQKLLHNNLAQSELYIVHKGSHVPQVDFPKFINERMDLFISNQNTSH
jgi:non-heme chloroperoxidase